MDEARTALTRYVQTIRGGSIGLVMFGNKFGWEMNGENNLIPAAGGKFEGRVARNGNKS